MEGISVHATLGEYLAQALSESSRTGGVRLDPNVRAYLLLLLNDEARGRHGAPSEALAPQLALAMQRRLPPMQRRLTLQMVGDTSLVHCGLWWMWHERPHRSDALDFYLDAGRFAYRQLREDPPFEELWLRFGVIVDVLARMGLTGAAGSMGDTLRLFRIWERTASEHAAKLLLERGVNVFAKSTPS